MDLIKEVLVYDEESKVTHPAKTFAILPGWAWDVVENRWVRVEESEKEVCCG